MNKDYPNHVCNCACCNCNKSQNRDGFKWLWWRHSCRYRSL